MGYGLNTHSREIAGLFGSEKFLESSREYTFKGECGPSPEGKTA